MFSVELPRIETDALPGNMGSELPFRSISFRLSPARYLRLRSQVLTASRAVTYCINLLSHLMSIVPPVPRAPDGDF
jgi:hypothetical protein